MDLRPAPRPGADARQTEAISWDETHGLYKPAPLHDWHEDEVWRYPHAHEMPYNELLGRGFRSIGCAPFTRAVAPGQDQRAGRWWWEQPGARECGLHGTDRAR